MLRIICYFKYRDNCLQSIYRGYPPEHRFEGIGIMGGKEFGPRSGNNASKVAVSCYKKEQDGIGKVDG